MSKSKQIIVHTPENIALNLQLAEVGDRISCFIGDLLRLCVIVFLLLIIPAFLPSWFWQSELMYMMLMIWVNFVTFIVWHGYFIYTELKHGATPSKRRMGYRIISLDGSYLSASAVYIRNIVREIEIWLPIRLLVAMSFVPYGMGISMPQILPYLWILMVVFIPYMDKYNRRLGDILAGTIVIKTKKVNLEQDLAEVYKKQQAKKRDDEKYSFTFEMLDFYGKKELQTLEEIFRRADQLDHKSRRDLFNTVSVKIHKKIKYNREIKKAEAESFLKDFYTAQRKHLESKLMHGRSMKRKGQETKKILPKK